jgi:hypothetical protein
MATSERAEYVTRETIMKLLSDEEIAKVSMAETASALQDGSQYLDLEHLDQGVQRATTGTNVGVGHALPRSAVSNATWGKIVGLLPH